MKTIQQIGCILLIAASTSVFSQNLQDNNTDLILSYFSQSNGGVNNLNTLLPKSNTKPEVFIEQIGNYNEAFITTQKNKKQNLKQEGNENTYEYYSYYDSNPSSVNALQQGNNNSIQVFGQNELSKNINIIQKSDNKTIIIKNY